MPLDNGLYTIQNAYSSGFLKNTRVDNEVLLYDNGYADQSTVFKLKRIAGNCYTIMLDHTTLRLYVAEAPTATSESGDIVPGPVVAMSSSYSEIELQDAQAGTFRMGSPCSGTYFTLAKDAGNPNVEVAAPDGQSKDLWVFIKRIRLSSPSAPGSHKMIEIMLPSD